jgi:hypothetical protein
MQHCLPEFGLRRKNGTPFNWFYILWRLPRALTEVYEEARQWIVGHGIFAPGEMGAGAYEEAILAVAP